MKYQQIKSKIYKKMRKMYEQKSDKKNEVFKMPTHKGIQKTKCKYKLKDVDICLTYKLNFARLCFNEWRLIIGI